MPQYIFSVDPLTVDTSTADPPVYANAVQTVVGGFVVHGPLSPITEEDEDMHRWSKMSTDVTDATGEAANEANEAIEADGDDDDNHNNGDNDDDEDDDDDFDIKNSVFTRTKTKKFVKKS